MDLYRPWLSQGTITEVDQSSDENDLWNKVNFILNNKWPVYSPWLEKNVSEFYTKPSMDKQVNKIYYQLKFKMNLSFDLVTL